jgi:DNA-binding Lrp family transcriptional regulator
MIKFIKKVEYIKDMELDKKDQRILGELDLNARQTDSEIAKKVRLSKQVVNYRIKNLIKNKIISNFYTLINVGKLGLNSYYVFLQFENINKEQEKNLLRKIKNLPFIGWLVSGTGRWDAIALLYSDSISSFDQSLNKLINTCGKHLHEYSFNTLITAEHISYKFLSEDKKTKYLKQTERIIPAKLNKTDIKILEEISQNARESIVDISEETQIPLHKAHYHIKNLIKENIIEGFKPKIDVNKLGYQWHLLLIQFQKITDERKKEFLSFCKSHKNVYYVTSTIGNYNLMLDIHVKSIEDFKEVLLELKERFSDIIHTYESIIIFDEYKIDYFPKALIANN